VCSLAAANLDPNMLGAVTKKLDDVLDAKSSAIKDLHVSSCADRLRIVSPPTRSLAPPSRSILPQPPPPCHSTLFSLSFLTRLHQPTPAPPQYELTRVTKTHHDVIRRVYESKLTEFGMPV